MGVLAMLGAFADAGYPVPLSIRIMRPFITHETQSAVVMKAGDDTGRMLYGPADFQVSANTQNKTIEGHFTCYTKACVSKPENVSILTDVMTSNYVRGCSVVGSPFLTPKDLEDYLQGAPIHPEKSIIVMPSATPPTTEDGIVSLSGRRLPWDSANTRAETDTLPYLRDLWKLGNFHTQENHMDVKSQVFLQSAPEFNYLCFPGPCRRTVTTGDFKKDQKQLNICTTRIAHITGRGHWGADALPGDAIMRRGEVAAPGSERALLSAQITQSLSRHGTL
jgi:hypothetical protein